MAGWILREFEVLPVELLNRRTPHTRHLPERALELMLGEREAREVRALLETPERPGRRAPVVLLPGLLGSLLASVRGISTLIWFNPAVLFHGHLNLLDLDAEGTADCSPDVEIVPVGIEKLCYLKLILTLAREARLYEFPYDWRRHVEYNAHQLHTSLERWSVAAPDRRFTLVGHSLGGMVARTYLALYPREAERRIERVIMLGSPLQGAASAVLGFCGRTTISQVMQRLHPRNDVVRFALNLPVSYQLLPPPRALFCPPRAYPANWDLYDAEAWGLPGVRQDYLDDARRLHALLAQADPQVELIEIAGCHRSTVTDVQQLEGCAGAEGLASPAGRDLPGFVTVQQEVGEDAGDDTVPLWSTRLRGVRTYYVEENHVTLTSNDEVLAAVVELLYGGAPGLPETLPAPRSLTYRLQAVPFAQQVAELRQRLEQGGLRLDDLHLLFSQREH